MTIVIPAPIVKPFCNTGDKNLPPAITSTSVQNQETGIPPLQATKLGSGGIPVSREEFNGTLNFYTQQIQALVSGGLFTFDAAVSLENGGYPQGIVLYCASNNSYQKSLIPDNTFNFITTPSYINDGIHWSAIIIDDIYAKTITGINSINLHGASVGGARLKFYNHDNTAYVGFSCFPFIGANLNFELPQSILGTGTENIFVCDNTGVMGLRPTINPQRNFGSVVGVVSTWVIIAQLSLIPGDYLLSANILAGGIGGTPPIGFEFIITSIPPPASPTDSNPGDNHFIVPIENSGTGHFGAGCIADYYASPLTPTTYYLAAQTTDGNSAQISGRLSSFCLLPT